MPRPRNRVTVSVNGGEEADVTDALHNVGVERFVDRLVALATEKQEIAEQFAEVVKEAKDAGYHTGALRKVVKRRMESAEQRSKREDEELALDLMITALGEFRSTPLGEAALAGAS